MKTCIQKTRLATYSVTYTIAVALHCIVQTQLESPLREGLQCQALPKSWHCQKGGGGGGAYSCQDFLVDLVKCTKAKLNLPPKIITFLEKVTIYPQLVNISPEIILILQNMLIYALFIDCCETHLHTFCYGNPSISEKPS